MGEKINNIKTKIKIILIIILGGNALFLFTMMIVLGGGSTVEETINIFQLKMDEKYIEEALEYADKLRDKSKKDKSVFKMSFEDFLTYALYNSNDWLKFNNKYLEEAYYAAIDGQNILKKDRSIEQFRGFIKNTVSSYVGKYEQKKIETVTITKEEIVNGEIVEKEIEKKVTTWEEKWGLRAFYPIPQDFRYRHYNDFGATRTYGGERQHMGNDIMADKGVPLVAIEAGIVEAKGWNEYGGWRIGIRTMDGNKYYYYAHMDRYADNIGEGSRVNAGQVIGYIGDSGYGPIGTKGKFENHLHLQIEVTYDINGQKEKVWIDPYPILKFLEKNKAKLKYIKDQYQCINEIKLE